MASLKYERGSSQTLMTTELNSLANGSSVVGTTEYDNSASANLYFWADFEMSVTYVTAPTNMTPVEIFIIPAENGTDYADADTSNPPRGLLAGAFMVRNTTATQRIVARGLSLPAAKFKLMVRNNTGQAFAASGNTITMYPYRTQSA